MNSISSTVMDRPTDVTSLEYKPELHAFDEEDRLIILN